MPEGGRRQEIRFSNLVCPRPALARGVQFNLSADKRQVGQTIKWREPLLRCLLAALFADFADKDSGIAIWLYLVANGSDMISDPVRSVIRFFWALKFFWGDDGWLLFVVEMGNE